MKKLVFCALFLLMAMLAGSFPLSADTLQSPNEKVPWEVAFYHKGEPSESKESFFVFEVLVNQAVRGRIEGRQASINTELARLSKRANPTDVITLILLNSQFVPVKVHQDGTSRTSKRGEIPLYFFPGISAEYRIDVDELYPEMTDYHFFYIEKSGGISNLGEFMTRIEPFRDGDDHFLVYFFGPANRPVIAREQDELNRLVNDLYTAITQPPLPREELSRVTKELEDFLPHHRAYARLNMYFYISETAFGFLLGNFLTPLLENWIPSQKLDSYSVTILTDFNISRKDDRYQYINLENQQ